MRIYFVDLNKTLKDISEQSQDIWKSFRKIKENMGAFTPKEADSLNIMEVIKKIKGFRQDLNNKYTVTRSNPSQTKIESPATQAPWVKSQVKLTKVEVPKVEEPELKKQSFSAVSTDAGDFKGNLITLLTRFLSTRSIG